VGDLLGGRDVETPPHTTNEPFTKASDNPLSIRNMASDLRAASHTANGIAHSTQVISHMRHTEIMMTSHTSYATWLSTQHSWQSKFNLAEWLFRILLSRGTRVQISSWSLRLRFDLSSGTNRGNYHGYSCGGTSSSGGSAWRRLP
jgi:hypothetical protein